MPPIFYEIIAEYGNNPFQAMWFLFSHGLGLITIVPIMIWYGWAGWRQYTFERTKQRRNHLMFKIDVPQLNEQSMKAVEQIFVHIYGGALDSPNNLVETYWDGFWQDNFSFEIVSKGGYISFYVRAPDYHKDLVQAAFYAQYPDAILTEVEDYTEEMTVDMIMEGKVKVWGSEFLLERDDTMPIRSWPQWEHSLVGRAVDPLASVLEVMSRLDPGEEWWFQILAQPADLPSFKLRVQAEIDKVVEAEGFNSGGKDWVDKIIQLPLSLLETIHDSVVSGEWSDADSSKPVTVEQRKRLTTPERVFVEELDNKRSRWVFKSKIRFMYFAEPKIYSEAKGRRGLLGALALYRFINTFVEGMITRVAKNALKMRWFFPDLRVRWRARRMFWAYRSRDMQRGEHDGFILNTEELASLFHFPQIEVRAPYVSKSSSRGVEPPTQLDFDDRRYVDEDRVIPTVSVESGQQQIQSDIPVANIVPEQPLPGYPEQPLAQQQVYSGQQPQTVQQQPPVQYQQPLDQQTLSHAQQSPAYPSTSYSQQQPTMQQPAPNSAVSVELDDDISDKGAPPSNLPVV
ncbi:MAG: hypothetical protein Q8P90_01160 [bacterium]|nr:hypothetical protein [bacterium]